MDKLLSTNDVIKLIGYPIKMITYDDLEKYNDVNKLFDYNLGNVCLILIRNSLNTGHWVILTKVKDIITFFDSYGGFIDSQLDNTPVNYYPNLSKLLVNYLNRHPNKVQYNPFQLQRYDSKVATCGRWCALYVQNKDMPIDDFIKVMKYYKKKIDLDELVTLLTK